MRRLFAPLVGALGLAVLAAPTFAQQAPAAPPPPVRGDVQSLDGAKLTVLQASGPVVVTLSADWRLTVLKKIDVGAIQPGSFIGTTNKDNPDGTGVSTEVHVFPPGLRLGEGHYPMQGQDAMMTNGDVTMIVTGAKGQELDIKYNGSGGQGVRHVTIPPGTPVVQMTPGVQTDLKPGWKVLVFAAKAADGSLTANGVITGEGGSTPPL